MRTHPTAYRRGFSDACRILWYVVAYKLPEDDNYHQPVLRELIEDLQNDVGRDLDDRLLEEFDVREISAWSNLPSDAGPCTDEANA